MDTQLSLFDDILIKYANRCSSTSLGSGTASCATHPAVVSATAAAESLNNNSKKKPTAAASKKAKGAAEDASVPIVCASSTTAAAAQQHLAHVVKAITLFVFPHSVIKYLQSMELLPSSEATVSGASQGPPTSAVPSSLATPHVLRLPPFASDSQYLVAKEAVYVLTTWVRNASNLHIHDAMQRMCREAGLSLVDGAACLSECLDRLVVQVASRLERMDEQPRLVRVAHALQMNRKEIDALTYLQVCHCGSNFVFTVNNALSPSAIAKFTEMNPKELLHFVAEYRDHMKQGLVQLDSMGRTSLMESRLTLSQEVVAAFTGENLSEEQLIKLEKTSLATVLIGERGHATSTPGSAQRPISVSATRDAAIGGGDYGGADDGNTRKRLRSGPGSDASQENSGDELSSDDEDDDDDDEEALSEDAILVALKKLKAIQDTDPDQAADLTNQLAHLFDSPSAVKMMKSMGIPLPTKPLVAKTIGEAAATRKAKERKKKTRRNDDASDVPSEGCSPLLNPEPSTRVDESPTAEKQPHQQQQAGSVGRSSAPLIFSSASSTKMNEPYTSDIDYIDDAFKILSSLIKIRNAEGDMKDDVEDNFYNVPKTKVEATIRELKGKFRLQSHVHKARLEATRAAGGGWLPRIEQLAAKMNLSEMEKQILLLLVGNVVSHDVLIAINGRYVMRDGQRELNVGYMLFVLCDGLKERVASRRYFYQSAPLIANALISVNLTSTLRTCFNTDLTDYAVDIDRKIVDYLMGTETQTAEMVPGSKLYTPTVPLENVVLPNETTTMVLNTIEHFSLFDRCKKQCGFGEGLGSNGSGLVFLFYGPSGTGKTMLANAVAHNLKKKLLLVNLLQFKSDARSPEVLRFIFREAKLNDAVVFFDECETFFETREANPLVTALLVEFERNDGIIILATNRAQVIDEAMNRRISLMIEFKLPDHQMREKIWRAHLPKQLTLTPDVNFEGLALDFELSGGLIRNAMLAAISNAVARDKTDAPMLTLADLTHGAKQQLRGFFLAAERPAGSEAYITPKRNLEEIIVETSARQQLETIAKLTKSRNTLFSQWGFNEHDCVDQGAIYLFHGPSGTGKSLAVEGIAYECGATIRMCNVQEIVMGKEVHIQTIFDEARKLGAIVVFDNAQVLFDYSERSQQVSQLIQYHAVMFPRPVIVVATTGGSTSASASSSTVDARGSKLQFTEEIAFTMPSRSLRKELWRRALPDKVPLAPDVDFHSLSEHQVTAKLIRSVCFSACCKVALLQPDARILTMKLLVQEKEDAMMRERRRSTHSTMFA